MAIKTVFSMTNPHTQNGSVGICTAISYAWAKQCITKRGAVNSRSELPSDHAWNIQMATLRTFDSSPSEQSALAGTRIVKEMNVTSFDNLAKKAKQNAPHVCIFWTDNHTMGYRYAHNEKEFFDNETGLFRAKTTKEITNKMKDICRNYGSIRRMRVLNVWRNGVFLL